MDETDRNIAAAIRVQRKYGMTSESDDNFAIARGVLHNELGYKGERPLPYHLSEDTRDILLAHARQDAAHTLSNSISLLRNVKVLIRLSIVSLGVNVALLIVIVVLVSGFKILN